MSIIPATPYRLKNVASGNVIALSSGWPHNNGLCAYGGDQVVDDQLWVFLPYDGYFKIMSYVYLGSVIADSGGNICGFGGDNNDDQHWQIGDAQGDYITISQRENSIIDPNASGRTGSLGTAPTASHDNRAVWMPIAAAPG